jgi:hypothetical protein
MPLGPLEDICEFRLYIIKRLFSQLQHSTILNNNYTTPVKKKSLNLMLSNMKKLKRNISTIFLFGNLPVPKEPIIIQSLVVR